MKLLRLMPEHFGKLHNVKIELRHGINVIYGENETGKSTLHSFILGMLFGIDGKEKKGKEDLYTKYQPWETSDSYKGSMEFEQDDVIYRINRNFDSENPLFTVTRLDTKEEVKVKSLSSIIPNLTECNFKNTISVKQLHTKVDTELAKEVENYLANLSTTMSSEVDVTSALEELKEKKQKLEAEQIGQKLKELKESIKQGRMRIQKMDQFGEEKRILQQQKKAIRMKRESLLKQEEQINLDLDSAIELSDPYLRYEEKREQFQLLDLKYEEAKERLFTAEGSEEQTDKVKEAIKEAEELQNKQQQIQKQITQKQEEWKSLDRQQSAKKNKWLVIGGVAVLFGIWLIIIGLLYRNLTKGTLQENQIRQLIIYIGGAVFVLIGSIILTRRISNIRSFDTKLNQIEEEQIKIENELNLTDRQLKVLLQTYQVKKLEELRQNYETQLTDYAKAGYIRERIVELEKEREQLKEEMLVLEQQFQNSSVNFQISSLLKEMKKETISPKQRKQELLENRETLRIQIKELEQKETDCILQLEQIDLELSSYEEREAALQEEEEMYQQMKQKVFESEQELLAVDLALKTIEELSVDIHESFGQELNETISEITNRITDGAYSTIRVNEKLEIFVLHNTEFIPLERFGLGTIEQIYLALRLSVAELFFGENPMPIILDDEFALYDNNRTLQVLKMLSKLNRQVILFTCQHREEELLTMEGIPYTIIEL